jgi:single stranded DNA-binding protein
MWEVVTDKKGLEGLNQAQIIGNIEKNPVYWKEENFETLRFSVATNEEFIESKGHLKGQTMRRTTLHKVVCLGPIAARMKDIIRKGSRVAVIGPIVQTELKTEEGYNRTTTEIEAKHIVCESRTENKTKEEQPQGENLRKLRKLTEELEGLKRQIVNKKEKEKDMSMNPPPDIEAQNGSFGFPDEMVKAMMNDLPEDITFETEIENNQEEDPWNVTSGTELQTGDPFDPFA